MSKSALLKSSLAKKYWMALTGLFLCTFLVGHLLGNLQLVFKTGEEGRRAFNEYAYFMGHNIFIKILSWLTYISIIFHAVDGLMLAVQNKKARPQGYAYNNQGANTALPARYMAILGTLILVFIVTHMANFWYHMKVAEDIPLHTKFVDKTNDQQNPMTGEKMTMTYRINYLLTTKGEYLPVSIKELSSGMYINPNTGQPAMDKDTSTVEIKDGTHIYNSDNHLMMGEGYKDLYTLTVNFFSQKSSTGLIATILYVIAMFVLMFHLWHGFASAFQSLGVNHKGYNGAIKIIGKAFAVLIPLAFAMIPVILYTR